LRVLAVAERAAEVAAALSVNHRRGQLEAPELTRIAQAHIPHVVIAPGGGEREAAKGRRVITHGVQRNTVAVTGDARASAAPGQCPLGGPIVDPSLCSAIEAADETAGLRADAEA